jgi:ribosomal protein L12E/L44/L45/RPP1/RPP2
MKTIFLTATIALFMGQQNVSAIALNQKTRFVDDVVRLLADAEKEDLESEQEPAAIAQCNPCYNSSLGPNPHYPYKAEKTQATGTTVGVTTDYKGPVKSDADLGGKPAEKKGLAQIDCNPCPNSSAGKNPHYPFVAKAGDKKEEDKKEDKKEEAKKEGLSQVDCNPCYQSNKGKNPHYSYSGDAPAMSGYQPGKDPSGGQKMIVPGGDKKALAQIDCNPCYQSNLGPNPHYDYEGNKKAQPNNTTAAPKKDDKKEEAKKDALAQLDVPAYNAE